jgi:hypothetical protein
VFDGGPGQRRHEALGEPSVPSLIVDGDVIPLLHPSQIATALGLPRPEGADSLPTAYDTAAILESWVGMLPLAHRDLLLAPTPSRGRSIRNLTVNTFHPFELLPAAWEQGRFDWHTGEADLRREEPLRTVAAVTAYAQDILARWQGFLLDRAEELADRDPVIGSNRGDTPFSTLLQSQRWHAAFHHRQIVDVLRRGGVDVGTSLDVEAIPGLDLPDDLY